MSKSIAGPAETVTVADTGAFFLEGPHLAVNADFLYWSETFAVGADMVWRIPLDGSAAKAPASQALDAPSAVILVGGDVVVGTYGGSMVRVDTSSSTVLATSAFGVRGIAADSSHIYWLESGAEPDFLNGVLRRCDLPDCANQVTLDAPIVDPITIGVDQLGVYYTTSAGEVRAIVKP